MASIEKIQINNFKSHKKFITDLSNDPQQIVVYGENGIGKTNLIEALSFFSNSKGLRGDNIEKVITNHDQVINTNIKINILSNHQKYNLSLFIKEKESKLQKILYLDDKKTSLIKIKEIISFIWLTPYMDKIMYEGQSIKRKFLDKMIAQNNKIFNNQIIDYQKNVSERIQVLRSSKDEKWLNIIETKISEKMLEIFKTRRSYSVILNDIIKKNLEDFRLIEIIYNNLNFNFTEDKNILLQLFKEKLKTNRDIDEISKRTSFSINTDEVIIFDSKKKLNSEFCSTGEQKACLLTIILANCWKLKNENKDFILLLDEATSHIDEGNFSKLINEIEKFKTQIWYTGTSKKLFQVVENKAFFIHLQ